LNSDAGISFTEFSYQILQGMDFLELYRRNNCVLQVGGSDQWGNLTSGTDLIHKVEGKSAFILATPLITDSEGKKFGKSEGNAIWLDTDLTSPYAFYQFWLNVEDSNTINLLKVFTFLSKAEIDDLEAQLVSEPHLRAAQKKLAYEVTSLVHSTSATDAVIAASQALFGLGELDQLDKGTLEAALSALPNTKTQLGAGVAELLVETGLVASLSAGRRAIAEGGVYLNNLRIDDEKATLDQAIMGEFAVLRRGKKTLAGIFIQK
jgi:tyrosyl-tRNA synthetase